MMVVFHRLVRAAAVRLPVCCDGRNNPPTRWLQEASPSIEQNNSPIGGRTELAPVLEQQPVPLWNLGCSRLISGRRRNACEGAIDRPRLGSLKLRNQSLGRARVAAILLLSLFVVTGCGSQKATVIGSVSYQGKPVTSGEVVLIDDAGRATMPAYVRPDGSFAIREASVGRKRVLFRNPKPSPLPEPDSPPSGEQDPELKLMAEALATYTPTPDRYWDPGSSEIVFDLAPGENTCNIELK